MLLICPECKSAVQDNAGGCPECGCPMAFIRDHQPKPATEYSAYTDAGILEAAAAQGDINAMYWLCYFLDYSRKIAAIACTTEKTRSMKTKTVPKNC